jgi:hypothetical protein
MSAEKNENGKDVGRLMRPTIQTSVAKEQMETEIHNNLRKALVVTNPAISGVIAVGGVVISILQQKLRASKDDLVSLVGYRVVSLNHAEYYPHGLRDKQDVPDVSEINVTAPLESGTKTYYIVLASIVGDYYCTQPITVTY